MNIDTEQDLVGLAAAHPLQGEFMVLEYAHGGISMIPRGFFRDWLDREAQVGRFQIGRCSGFGVGSVAKFDSEVQALRVGRFVSGGQRLRFVLNGQHETRTISTYMFSICGMGINNPPPPQYGDSVIRNDVWMGDEVMMLGGGLVENGCIIGARALLPPNFRSEPYGIYAGSPARLIRFRFTEKVREALLALAWWDMPLTWIRAHNHAFMQDLGRDEGASLALLAELQQKKTTSAVA